MKNLKQKFKMLTTAIIAVTLATSCGSKKSDVAKVKPEKVEITGDLSDYLQVVDGEYEVADNFGGHLSIKVKALKALSADEMNDKNLELSASLLNETGMPVSGTGDLICYVNNDDKLLSLLKKGTGEEIIELSSLLGQYDAKEHADKVKKFSVSSTMKEKESSSSTSESSDNSSASSDNSSSTDCDKFIEDYEAFVDSYITIIKKYKDNPNDAGILTEYTEVLQKAAEMQTNSAKCNDPKYASKLMDIVSKMAKAASAIK